MILPAHHRNRTLSPIANSAMPLSLSAARTLDVVTDRDVLSAAARDVRTVMRRRQAAANALDPAGWEPPDPVLLALAGNRRFLEPAPRTFYLPLSASARQIPEYYSRYGRLRDEADSVRFADGRGRYLPTWKSRR